MDGIGKLDVTIEHDGKSELEKVDDDWLKNERKRIEDRYTYLIKNFGWVILYNDRDAFDKATSRFKSIVENYQKALREALVKKQSDFEKRIVDEFSPRWEKNPPEHFARWRIEATAENVRAELQKLAQELFNSAITFEPPVVKIFVQERVVREHPTQPRLPF